MLHLIAAPTAAFNCTPNGLTVKCDGSNSSGQIDNYAWDWGDGSTDGGANKKHPSHKYNTTTDKTYTITLTVSNSGGKNSATQTVSVTAPSPTPSPVVTPPSAPPASSAPAPTAASDNPAGPSAGLLGALVTLLGVTSLVGLAALR